MKFKIKPIEIKEKVITIETFIDPEEESQEFFGEISKGYESLIGEFKENDNKKLFDFIYKSTETLLGYSTPAGHREFSFGQCFKATREEVTTETITPEIKSDYAFTETEVYNREIQTQLKKELKISDIDPFEFNVSFDGKQEYDVFKFYKKSGHAHKVYGVVHRKNKELTTKMLAVIVDHNLCFGFRLGESRNINDSFSYQEIIIHTD